MKRRTYYDYSRRISRFDHDTISGLAIPWDSDIVSSQGAHYHCWIPSGLTKENQQALFEKFRKAARIKGDQVSFSWDYIPEGKV